MESIYASKSTINKIDNNTQVAIQDIVKIIERIKTAPIVNDDCRQNMINSCKEIQRSLVRTSREIDDLNGEIELAYKLYKADYPEHKNRFFVFDENGEIRETDEEEYNKVTPKDTPDEEVTIQDAPDEEVTTE